MPEFSQTELITLLSQNLITDGHKEEFIAFYNTIYLPQMKPYLNSLNSNRAGEVDSKGSTPLLKSPLIPMFALASPLRESLSQSTTCLSQKSPMVRSGITPNDNFVFVVGVSPSRDLEKINRRLAASKHSKHIINFESAGHEEKKLINPVLKRIKELQNKVLNQAISPQFMPGPGSIFNRYLSSESIQSQESTRNELLASNSNMISEFDSSANPTNSTLPNTIPKLDFVNIKQQQKQLNDGYKSSSNIMCIEENNSETN